MEIFAFNENAVGYEDQKPEPQLRSFDVEIPKSAVVGAAGIAAATAVMSAAPEAQAVVGPGDRCAAVGDVQSSLNGRGFNAGSVDSVFGVQTTNAVRSFQAFNNLSVDGVVGPSTADALGLGDVENPNSPYLVGNSCTGGGGGQERSGTVTASSGLNVRSGPGTGFAVVGSLGSGSTVFYSPASQNGFVQITSGTYSGSWVSSSYISTSGGGFPPGGGSGQERSGTVTASSGLNVRSGPGTGFSTVGSLGSGSTVFYFSNSTNGFVQIASGAYTGNWVSSTYISTAGGGGGGQEFSGTVTASSGLIVRSGPGTGFSQIGGLAFGSTVFYDPTRQQNGFVPISTGGWVSRAYIN